MLENEVQHIILCFEHFYGDISSMNKEETTVSCTSISRQVMYLLKCTMQYLLVDTVYYGEENSVSAAGG